ncbi:baseplate assembly protein [Magnetofaba australis]|uniref:Putative phage baseplate J-like protein n=1 Tax=Magnetofaba australis IT-1 TaxID=1434232 RepID=A0A1Y2K137_9PROT|nr:baseplate J/gp47 family protein [Magnetofaba australis]OSM01659.1 putative phage baseplate J-like protein [Magnetofaba australis IT-1]
MSVVDLSQLPSPDVVEAPDYESILTEMKSFVSAAAPELAPALSRESEPVVKLLEAFAYRELLLRQRVNDGARAVMLAHAVGADLENLAALLGISRQVIDPGDVDATPPLEPVMESDDRLRERARQALEGIAAAGPVNAYRFHAFSADPLVKDVAITSPSPGQVLVTVLSDTGDGTPDQTLLETVNAALNAESVRPLTDQVMVQGASITPYQVQAQLHIEEGPDAEVVRQASLSAVTAYCFARHGLGLSVTLSGLYAALHQPGVLRVSLLTPSADIDVAYDHALFADAISVEAVP